MHQVVFCLLGANCLSGIDYTQTLGLFNPLCYITKTEHEHGMVDMLLVETN